MSPSLFPNYSSTLRGGCRASFLFAVAGAERQKRVCSTLCCEDFVPERKLQRGDDLRRATSLSLFSTLTPLSTSFTPEKKTRAISTIEKLTDYLTKVVVQGKQSSSLHVREIMTARSKLLTVPPQVREEKERGRRKDKRREREKEETRKKERSHFSPRLSEDLPGIHSPRSFHRCSPLDTRYLSEPIKKHNNDRNSPPSSTSWASWSRTTSATCPS